MTLNIVDRPALHVIGMAATSVAKATRVPQGMTALTLPAGSYKYPLSRLAKGFGEIFSRLLPSFDPGDSNSPVEICLPVRSRS